MKRYRVLILAVIAGLALALPFSELGALGIHLVAPMLLGVFVTWLFGDVSVLARAVLLVGVTGGVALTRICWQAVVLEGNWRFDGEWGLEAMSVVFQLFFATGAFIATWFVLSRRRHAA